MPAIFAALGVVLAMIGPIVGRVLLALGIGYVTYTGFDTGISYLKTYIQTSIGGMPSQVVAFLAFMWVDKAIGMVFSTYSVAMAFKLAGSTVMRKAVQK